MKTERGVMCEKKRKIIKIRKTENEVNNGRERERERKAEKEVDRFRLLFLFQQKTKFSRLVG